MHLWSFLEGFKESLRTSPSPGCSQGPPGNFDTSTLVVATLFGYQKYFRRYSAYLDLYVCFETRFSLGVSLVHAHYHHFCPHFGKSSSDDALPLEGF